MKTDTLKSLDLPQIIAVLFLITVGLAVIYSATYQAEGELQKLFPKQLLMTPFGLLVFAGSVLLPPRFYYVLSYVFYVFAVLLLILVLVVTRGGEPARWIYLGSFNFQPSEVAKVALVFTLARFISEKKKSLNKLSTTVQCVLITALPMILVMIEPDLGTSGVFAMIALPMMFAGGISISHIMLFAMPVVVLLASLSIYALIPTILIFILIMIRLHVKPILIIAALTVNVAIGFSGPKAWNSLHPYQQRRILTFLDPEADPRGAGYQIIQAKIAVGSGGFAGKGYLDGTQSHLRFLPAGHTDFIFAVYSEEFGFFGACLVIGAFLVIVLRGLNSADRCRNRFNSLIILGACAHFASHVLVNIGMATGILPVTGLPLPFMSYGGSSLMLNLTIAGAMIGMSMRWKEY